MAPKNGMIRPLCNMILRLFGAREFIHPDFGCNILLKQFIIQKVFRVNSHVPWPVHFTSTIINPQRIQRGSRFPGLGSGTYLDGRNGIVFGENVWVGPKVSIISMNHKLEKLDEYEESEPVRIGNNCWIGAHAIILPGVNLGDGTIVAAGAVVTKSFESTNQVIAGNPAVIIKTIEK